MGNTPRALLPTTPAQLASLNFFLQTKFLPPSVTQATESNTATATPEKSLRRAGGGEGGGWTGAGPIFFLATAKQIILGGGRALRERSEGTRGGLCASSSANQALSVQGLKCCVKPCTNLIHK